MNIEANNKKAILTYKFSGYTQENLCKLYRVLKGKSLNPHGYETNKYKSILFEMMKDIEILLHKDFLSEN
ncbi:hypothetical protein P148_SR1C00001G0452 [candidate division SR1 bacterium RAAC1_SR1_1]|nr:hypothetical protein P148_SR1C00001G0452 [candidate division SR1 bacterium RAAC1_SR1_1]